MSDHSGSLDVDFEVKMCKTYVEKVHAVGEAHLEVKMLKPWGFGPLFLEVQISKKVMSKKCNAVGAKHIWKSKCQKTPVFGPLLEVQISKKVHAVVDAKHIWKSKCKKHRVRTTFGIQISKK